MKRFQDSAVSRFSLALALVLLVAVQGSDAQLSYGADCGHAVPQFCSKESGLICGPDFKCGCSHGVAATGLEYQLEWDATQRKCLAQPDTPCFGTKDFPVPVSEQNTAVCVSNYDCVGLKHLPPGVGLCKPKTTLQSYGTPCNKDTFCDKAAGLICNTEFRCGCSHGLVSHDLEYKLAWNTTVGKCLGEEGSACNTEQAPVHRVTCGADLVCKQLEDNVPGIGVCQSIDHDPEPGEGSSTPDDSDSAAAMTGLGSMLLFVSTVILVQVRV